MRRFKKRRKIYEKEDYAPVEEWFEAPERYANLPLQEGEVTVIVESTTGRGLYLVAKLRGIVRYVGYLDSVKFKENFKKVSPDEIRQRARGRKR
jgi:hypothetical protein